MKTWEHRFDSRTADPLLEAFNASISKDRFLYAAEIKASLAYARALRQAAILTAKELQQIKTGLPRVKKRIEQGEKLDRFEDIHSTVELILGEEIGVAAKKLHTGRSRNEQVAVDERIYLKESIPLIMDMLRKIQRSVIRLAEKHSDVIMPGYTHLQQAQYVLFAHYIMSLFWPIARARARLHDALARIDTLTLGVGALAGSTAAIDRDYLKKYLGFSALAENSMDAVSDRSFILETLFVLSLLLLDLSRYAEDFIIFSSREFGYLVFDDCIATSSSLMPQKKNPDFFELIRAGSGRLYGYLTQLFITVKGLPSTYNKDLQNDKVPLRQGIEETLQILTVFNSLLKKIKPDHRRIKYHYDSFLCATDLVDYLGAKGVPFREAHGIIGKLVSYAEKSGVTLSDLKLKEFQRFSPLFALDVFDVFDPAHSIRLKKTSGSTNPELVQAQIKKAKKMIGR